MNRLNDNGHKAARREMRNARVKALFMLTMMLCVGTAQAQVLVKGSVFGGGKGDLYDEKAGHVKGNTNINMEGGTVERSVYGGGEQGSVGTFTTTTVTYPNGDTVVVVPTTCTSGGMATVSISGGTVGRADQALMPAPGTPLLGDDFGYIFCGGRGEVDTINYPRAIALGVVGNTTLNISGTALITAAAYGGSENGIVLGNTLVNMSGGQIGVGHYKEQVGEEWVDRFDGPYTPNDWSNAISAVQAGTIGTTYVNPFHECDSWPYGDASGNHYVYDIFADDPSHPNNNPSDPDYNSCSVNASDGHSFFGNLFGGGSGYYPYAPGQWRRTAGQVKGNTTINLTGGHILTSLYAGNETTDIIGKSTVNMSGGTIGVPRTLEQIQAHPVTCYLFGGGMGDPRTYFNKWTNVNESEINITGGTIFGSVFGGGEEGHVLGDVAITINQNDGNTLIGTLGYSYVDGNVFGAGRGLSGMALTAGGVGGNVTVNIQNGTMLGSVYGGGRLASVGTYFVPAGHPDYGQFQEGDSHGHVTINISGGIIGNDDPTDNALPHPHGGNVFGGSMGRLKDINNANYLPLWHRLARVKETHVNITGGTIKNVVYGGSEYGSVYDKATVVVNDENLYIRKVYGGGYGSDIIDAGYVSDSAAYPALLAGRVEGNTLVEIKAGTIGTNVYGGGDLATVGVVKNGMLLRGNTNVVVSGGYIGNATNYAEENTNPDIEIGHVYGGGQGIQHDFENYKAYCNVNSTNVTIEGGNVYGSVFGGGPDSHVLGNTSVTLLTGAHIGTSGISEWDGDVFGGGKGNTESLTAGRVGGNTFINMENGILMGNIYGGGRFAQTGVDVNGDMQDGTEHGHTKVMVKGGTVGNPSKIETFTAYSMGNIYGGGKGYIEDKNGTLPAKSALLLGLTKNTEIEISNTLGNNTHVYGLVLGGGELANVGHYTLTENDGTHAITNIEVTEGLAKVSISGGTIGGDRAQMRYELEDPSDPTNFWLKYNDDLGYVYGGGEGLSDDPDNYVSVQENESTTMSLLDLMATVQNTEVEISGGWVKASVFGGSESGHVKGNTKVTISGGQIGAGDDGSADVLYDNDDFINPLDNTVITSMNGTAHWQYGQTVGGNTVYNPFDPAEIKKGITGSGVFPDDYGYQPSDGKSWFGNVFGGGSGWFPYVTGTGAEATSHWNPLSGKVWGNTEVIVTGGHILNNVYGANEATDVGGKATVKISGGTVGVPRTPEQVALQPVTCYVFGGGAGDPRPVFDNITNVASTDVQITGGTIYGSVFGGAEDGHVLGNVLVTVSEEDYTTIIGTTGKSGADGNIFGGGRNFMGYNKPAGRVGGNITLNMTGGTLLGSVFGGGRLGSVGVDENGNMQEGTEHGYTYVNIGVDGDGTAIQTGNINIGHSNDDARTGGNVYGGGMGIVANPEVLPIAPQLAYVKQTQVNIGEASGETFIRGSVFGGGDDSHVKEDTYVNISGGQIGGETYGGADLCENIYHGSVYGAGRGLSTWKDDANNEHYSTTAGWVQGNTNVSVTGGHIYRDVFGGGYLSSVGTDANNTGLTTVSIAGDAVIGTGTDDFGRVFGAGKGIADPNFASFTNVYNTDVTIAGSSRVYGSVYGGGEVGHVIKNASEGGNTKVTIDGSCIVGTAEHQVYGGGLGSSTSLTAGKVAGIASATVKGNATINGSVLGGGEIGLVEEARIVNIEGGTVNRHVLGGNNTIPTVEGVESTSLMTVNVRGGAIEGSVFGGSYNALEGNNANTWNSFVNVTGGTIGYTSTGITPSGNLYAAGYGGEVDGSVCLNVGLTAVQNAPTFNSGSSTSANIHYKNGLNNAEPTPAKVKIEGNLYDGSYRYQATPGTNWLYEFDITGYSTMFIDGEGYNTANDDESSTLPYMNICGGIYGGGNYCESGILGRKVIIKDYGQRVNNSDGSLSSATRTLTTLQRSGVALIDHSNIHFTGEPDLSQTYEDRDCFGILTVDDGLYVANGSSFVLGTDTKPAYMDSIVEIRSLHLKSGTSYDYINSLAEGNLNNWELIGVNYNGTNTPENAHLYYTETNNTTHLTYAEENVILFNGDSRMWVRYKNTTTNGKIMYGPLYGFFRMKADGFLPESTESFAYARPKLTANVNPIPGHNAPENEGDGGFLSYNTEYNDFTNPEMTVLQFHFDSDGDDGGEPFTNTKQYPYFNFSEVTAKNNMEEYRAWVLPVIDGNIWYVDGSKGWGQDQTHANGWGDYPDKPKLTITANDAVSGTYGIFHDPQASLTKDKFNPAKDIIFVVGPIQALLEDENLNPSMLNPDPTKHYSLKLYRYPGGHKLSNGQTDTGGTTGPGANLGALVIANKTTNFVMENVMVDGLFKEGDFTPEEISMYTMPASYNTTDKLNVNEPLVVTIPNAQLTLKGGTKLQHGYNNNDAGATWYLNADYMAAANVHDGGALYVDDKATVNVEGLVTITGNLQKNGSSNTECNVYLPTFNKYINMTNAMDENTRIGVTSPIRNQTMNHVYNTFSPVAVATPSSNAADTAAAAWRHCNFYDDQDWFFVNGNTNESPRTTFYSVESSTTEPTALYFGWTWGNVIRKAPANGDLSGNVTNDFNISSIDSPHDLAWLISLVNGENGQTANTLANIEIKLTDDIDMQQYLWVPIGIEGHPFGGTFDGQGKLIKNLTINYLGTGSRHYEYADFGMFGNVNNGTIDRTFVVDELIQPVGNVNIGGLAGLMQGNSVISNSEAAVNILIPDMIGASENASGGLVGLFLGGEIHSSMAMPTFYVGDYYTVGGLVGYTSGTPMLNNSFAYPKFIIADIASSVVSGGLVGVNTTGSIKNCYARLQTSDNLTTDNYGSVVHTNQGNVDNCFGFQDDKDGSNNVYPLAVQLGSEGSSFTNCHYFSAVASSDSYGYLYTDNQLYDWDGSNWTKADTCLFVRLSTNAKRMNNAAGDNIYAQWARPTLSEINGDYPVLLLNNYGDSDKIGQGEFRSLATYANTPALQYGGPARDGSGNELSAMLIRTEDIFVYGDVTEDLASATINAKKVAIHEDAAIIEPGALSNYVNTYVGVSFDNSARQTFDVNGLARDWHMLSTPLKNAPLGINYGADNDGTSDPSYDPHTGAGGVLPEYPFYAATVQDGYFPFNTPYAEYDFYCFNEYTKYNGGTIGSPHWINFKRNGNSHYYSQSWAPYFHGHIDYYPYDEDPMPAANINEPNLVQGKGYLLALQEDTYLQSHGLLNNSDVTINISNKAVDATHGGKAQNLVGNPFHAYLDFDKFATSDWTNSWTSPNDGLTGNAYYVYDADHGYYKSYTVNGSIGGDYANRYIHPHQGFFVKSTASENASYAITFAPSMLVTRSEAGEINFRGEERPAYPLVNLYAEDHEGRNEVVVIEFNRPENGGGLKVNGLRNGNHLLYAHNGDDDYCAFFAKEGTERVPVRFKTFEDGIFTMHWNTANGDFQSLYLIDNIAGLTCDMLKNDSYTFNALTSDYLSRFYIVFEVTDVDEFDDNHVFAFFDGNGWVINGKGHFDLIDMTGRVLYSTEFVNEQNRVNLSPYAKGIYLMRLSGDMNTTTQKIVHIK